MADERVTRRLAAILAADVVGYSRLMEQDENGTLAALKARWKLVLEPLVARHSGRIFKTTGDGVLVEFNSAVNAVQCAIELQRAMADANGDVPEARRIVLRVGVNLGDVIVEGSDLYGDGINIAARLQELAAPSSIAMSASVKEQVSGKIALALDDLGEKSLKNIERLVRVFATRSDAPGASAAPRPVETARPAARRLAIAVLPFNNMSGDVEQEYFSDGITEDIITDLSKVAALGVAARNSTFALKGKAMDVSEAARLLRVTHVLEGSVRKAGSRVRITAQLIDGATGHHLWAERYDRDLNDIFALQDEIARAIVDALKIQLMPAENAAIGKRTTENVEAYQYYLMGRQHFLRLGRRNHLAARRLYRRAIEIDPDYARARAGLALAEGMLLRTGDASASVATLRTEADRALAADSTLAEAHVADAIAHIQNKQIGLASAACQRAIAIDPDLYEAHRTLGEALRMDRKFAEAARAYEKAAEVDRNSYAAVAMTWDCRKTLGEEQEVRRLTVELLARVEKAMQLYPDDAAAYAYGCYALHYLGLEERALEWAERAIAIDPEDYNSHYNVACFLAVSGAIEKAIDTLEHCVPRLPWHQLQWMAQDVDMDPLRDHPRYQSLVRRLATNPAETEARRESESGTSSSDA